MGAIADSQGRHPEGPRLHQRAEGSPSQPNAGEDPSLRLQNSFARDDASSVLIRIKPARALRHTPVLASCDTKLL